MTGFEFKPATRTMYDKTNPIPSDMDRILRSVTVDDRGCWVWDKSKLPAGYGQIRMRTKTKLAHRVAFEVENGAIPAGYEIDHLCRNTSCCNPEHLQIVDPEVNRQRQGAAVTHCPRNHRYTVANTYIHPGTNNRSCRTCTRERNREARR